ncbi:MAG: uracil-DNA glycosylase, partial [SAR324 cluster bacterium]|nr:uracil-DNA glycosylase [SAR324 cluster bacterium]
PKEREAGRPFVWRAGRTLFRWFAELGVDEETFRKKVYMAAVIRCFPGKLPNRQGDRKPAPAEIANCLGHLERELELLAPQLLLPVGKMAIDLLTPGLRLDDAVGRSFDLARNGLRFTSIPLPHPSGLSRWIQTEQGKALTAQALRRIAEHPAWIATFPGGIPHG